MRGPIHFLLCGSLLLAIACNSSTEESISPTALIPAGPESACDHASPRPPWTGEACYDPVIDPADFAGVAEDNLFFPLVPGTTFHYVSETEDGLESNDVIVTFDTKTILGVVTTVVLDLEYLDGELVEETSDWYAQDVDGNVWYFGEATQKFDNGVPGSTEGSWEAGQNTGQGIAKPGIIMLADPWMGTTYRQEYAPGVAEDMARVVGLNRSVSVPYDEDLEDCLVTQDWNGLETSSQERKYYCPEIGLVLEVGKQNERNELQSITGP